jgi:hypothetical protein
LPGSPSTADGGRGRPFRHPGTLVNLGPGRIPRRSPRRIGPIGVSYGTEKLPRRGAGGGRDGRPVGTIAGGTT